MKSMIAIEQEASMTSLDFLRNIINPARIEYGEPEVENRHFLSRIEDEIDDLGVAGKLLRDHRARCQPSG